jgi:hypothetical protein
MKFILLLLALITLQACSITAPVVETEQALQQEIIISSGALQALQDPMIPQEDTLQAPQECIIFDDFLGSSNLGWGIVNDGVM